MFATGAESVTLHLIAACNLTWEVGSRENHQVCQISLSTQLIFFAFGNYRTITIPALFLAGLPPSKHTCCPCCPCYMFFDRNKAMPQCSTTNATPLYHPGTF